MRVLPLNKYCEIEGIEPVAVKRRVQIGMWRMGKEVIKLKGFRHLFVDIDAVERFMRDPKNQR